MTAPVASESDRREFLVVAAFSAIVLLWGLASGSLRDWDEAIYAQVAREMFETGNWLSPLLEGQPWFHKPPLYLWTTIAGYHVFGVGELAPRLGSAFSGIAGTALVFLFGTRAFGRTAGLVAAAAFLGNPLLLKVAKTGMLDVMLTSSMIAAFYAWWRSEESPAWLIVVGAALGIAMMTKGAAAGLAGSVLLLHLVWMGRYRVLGCWQLWLGVALALAIALPWHAHQMWFHGEAFWNEYVGYHVLSRAGGGLEGNQGGVGYYLAVLADEARPWSWLGALTLPFSAWIGWTSRSSALRLVVVWALVGLVVPTLMSTKIDWYVVPVVPAIALSIGHATQTALSKRYHPGAIVLASVLLLVGVATTKRVWNLDYSGPVKQLGAWHRQEIGPGENLCIYRMSHPAARFYFERPVRSVRGADDERLVELRAETPRLLCLTKLRFAGELSKIGGAIIDQADELALVGFHEDGDR